MVKKLLVSLVLIGITVLNGYALEVGVNQRSSYSISTADFNFDDTPRSKIDYCLGFGLSLGVQIPDSEVRYRLHLNYENIVDSGSPFFSIYNIHGIYIDNVFSKRFFHAGNLSLSYGFDVNLAYRFRTSYYTENYMPVATLYDRTRESIYYYSLGLGLILSIDFKIGDSMVIGLDLGIGGKMGIGIAESEGLTWLGGTNLFKDKEDNDVEYLAIEKMARICVMYSF
ncbi:MAG: hypothetical protein JXA20_19365 [Spirochaetes bacterium]|nr:hypothetical protein [Spirochaetota bacterium]